MAYGEYLGYCFQIKDDIFDYFQDTDIGKPTKNDLRDGKVTLPLIYALREASTEKSKEVLRMIQANNLSEDDLDYIYHFALNHGGVKYAKEQMHKYKKKAIDTLNDFLDNPFKTALIDCVEYAVNRSN